MTSGDDEPVKPSVVGNDESAERDVEIELNEASTYDESLIANEDGGDASNKNEGVTSCPSNFNQITTEPLQTEHLNEIVDVYATVMFENSPFENLQQEELESFSRCVKSIDHLARNITGHS